MRHIARLDVKGDQAVKGRCMDGWRAIGEPNELARRHYEQGADELLIVDVVASLYDRAPRWDVLEAATDGVFIPVTYCGGIRSVDDMCQAMRRGADKVAINTAALARPVLITECAREFGSQAVVVSIEAKLRGDRYEAYSVAGREPSGLDAWKWMDHAIHAGAGEVLVTFIDHDGTETPDTMLVTSTRVPVLLSGGYKPTSIVPGADGVVFG